MALSHMPPPQPDDCKMAALDDEKSRTDIINRLKAIDATRSPLPIPKGPMPTSMKGARSSMRGR